MVLLPWPILKRNFHTHRHTYIALFQRVHEVMDVKLDLPYFMEGLRAWVGVIELNSILAG